MNTSADLNWPKRSEMGEEPSGLSLGPKLGSQGRAT